MRIDDVEGYCGNPRCIVCSLAAAEADFAVAGDGTAFDVRRRTPPTISESDRRKATPIFSGVMRYFPDALAAVARVSKAGNDKHNPGQPLHWSRGKSTDHGDCIARHQITFDQIDEELGEYHAAAVAWRALAQLQLLEEARAKREAEPERGPLVLPNLPPGWRYL